MLRHTDKFPSISRRPQLTTVPSVSYTENSNLHNNVAGPLIVFNLCNIRWTLDNDASQLS